MKRILNLIAGLILASCGQVDDKPKVMAGEAGGGRVITVAPLSGTLDYTETCSVSGPRFSALDLDADGTVSSTRDSVILNFLMSGTFTDREKRFWAARDGKRSAYDIYYQTLLSLGLDVDGDGRVQADTDGNLIYLYMLNMENGGSGVPQAAYDRYLAPGRRVNFTLLAKLANKSFQCRLVSGPPSHDPMDYTESCTVEGARFSALDLDGDGNVSQLRDVPILLSLINGRFDARAKRTWPTRTARRAEYEVYHQKLAEFGLDVNGDRDVTEEDAIIIFLYLSQGTPQSAYAPYVAPGHRVNFAQLAKLASKSFQCRVGRGYEADVKFNLVSTAHFPNWGGDGLVWVWSRTLNEWMYLKPNGDLYEWEDGTNPARGTLQFGGLNSLYSRRPDLLVRLKN